MCISFILTLIHRKRKAYLFPIAFLIPGLLSSPHAHSSDQKSHKLKKTRMLKSKLTNPTLQGTHRAAC